MVIRPGPGQRERDRLVVGVEQQQQRVADDRFAALVHVADQVAGQAHAQALDEAGVPGVVGHLLAGRVEPGNVLDVGAADARGPGRNLRRWKTGCSVQMPATCATKSRNCLLLVVQIPVSQVNSLSWQ